MWYHDTMTSPSASSAFLAVGGKSRTSASTAPTGGRLRPRDHLVRAATAKFIARAKDRRESSESVAQRIYAGDQATPLLLRASVAPASTSGTWGGEIAGSAVADFIAGLSGMSASARLFSLATRVEFTRRNTISVPVIAATAADAGGWVVEGAPIPVKALTTATITMTPKKFSSIRTFSMELANATVPSIEAIIGSVLREATAQALDTAVLSATAASAAQPAGILAGKTPITATAGGGMDAMVTDLAALAAAVSPVSGATGQIIFVVSPARAVRMKLRAGANFDFEILASSAVADGTVIAIAPGALVSGFDPEPDFDTSDEAVLHMDDAPAQVSVTGTPNVVSAPVRSLWQSGLVAVRLILNASWALRSTNAVAVINSATW